MCGYLGTTSCSKSRKVGWACFRVLGENLVSASGFFTLFLQVASPTAPQFYEFALLAVLAFLAAQLIGVAMPDSESVIQGVDELGQ